MKFFSKITKKPNAVIKQVKDGLKIVSQKKICTFINGEYETDNPEIIAILKAHPNQFAADSPWNPVEKPIGNKVRYELLKYNELLIEAKKEGIKSKKKAEIIKALNEKEVI